jgi:hypothetical protein
MSTETLNIKVVTAGAVKSTNALTKSLDKLEKEGNQVDKQMKKTSKSFLSFGKVAGVVGGTTGVALLTSAFVKVIKETTRHENAIKSLDAILKSTGNSVGFLTKELEENALALSAATTFSDEDILEMQKVLLTFTKVTGESFEKATKTVLNMSAVFGTDLKGAAIQLGKALQDPIKGVSALTEIGVSFNAIQKKEIAGFIALNDLAGAQGVIMDELAVETGNVAFVMRNTLGGALKGLENDWDNLFTATNTAEEGVDDVTESVNELAKTLRSSDTKAAFAAMRGYMFELGKVGTDVLTSLSNGIIKFSRGAAEAKQLIDSLGGAVTPDSEYTTGGGFGGEHTGLNPQAAERLKSEGIYQNSFTELLAKGGDQRAALYVKHNARIKDIVESKELRKINEEQYVELILQEQKRYDAAGAALEKANALLAENGRQRIAIVRDTGKETESILNSQRDSDFALLQNSMMTEEESVRASYLRRKEIILQAVSATEEERTELEKRSAAERNQQLNEFETARTDMIISAGKEMFESLLRATAAISGEQSAAYKIMFATSKAFTIASSALAIQDAISKALAVPFPANIPAMAIVAAEGASIVSTIASTQYSGAYDKGGKIPSGQFGLVGENGPELVQGPAVVTSRDDTAALVSTIASIQYSGVYDKGLELVQSPTVATRRDDTATLLTQETPQVNLKVINVQEENAEDYLSSDPGERQVMNILRRNQTAIQGLMR